MKILMVCLGNICRSPLAEGIMAEKIKRLGLPWTVDSAGTGAYHVGESPDPRSQQVARNHQLDISHQRARQIRTSDFVEFDHILVMDASNYNNVRGLTSDTAAQGKVEMIMNYLEPGRNIQVPDPYWDNDGFEKVYQMLDRACEAFIERVTRGSEHME